MIKGAPINVLDYGASPSASASANAAAFQAAVDAGAGRRIYIPQGTYSIGSTITCPSGTWLEGDGAGETILQGSADVNVLLFQDDEVIDYTGAGIERLTVKGSGSTTRLVTVNNVWGFAANNCRIYGSPNVFRCLEIQRYSFECMINSCRITDATESCIYLNKIDSEPPNGCMITNCDFSPEDSSTAGGYGIYDEARRTKIIGNWFEYAYSAGPPVGYGGTAIYSTGSPIIIANNVQDGYFGNYAIHLNQTLGAIVSSNQINVNGPDASGIFVETCQNTVIDGNVFNIDIADYFVNVANSDRTIISNNVGKGTVGGLYDLVALYNIAGTSQDTQILNNAFSFQGGTAKGTGVIVGASTTITTITENCFIGLVTGIDVQTNASNIRAIINGNNLLAVTTGITFLNPLDVYLYNNFGFKTENRGYPAIIASGNTRVTVAHGLAVTPPISGIQLTLIDALGGSGGATSNDVQGPFIASVDATNIVIGCSADPGASGMYVAWEASFSI
jgi:hypothetical protein